MRYSGDIIYHIIAFMVVAVWGSTFVLDAANGRIVANADIHLALRLRLRTDDGMVCSSWQLAYVNPITTILFAHWILNEQITPWFLLGSMLILSGMYVGAGHSS